MTPSQTYQADILVVDDTATNLSLLTQILSSHGYRVRPVRSGKDALATAEFAPPDLILLDVMMPDMDGFEVAERLRAIEATSATPIIFISALGDTESKLRAFSSGGEDYITKPFQSEEVLARIQNHLRLRYEIVQRERLIDELQLLNKISRSLIVYDELEEMLRAVVGYVMHIADAQRAFLMLVEDENEIIHHFVQTARDAAPLPVPTYADVLDGLPGWVIRKLQPVISPKGQSDPREGARSRQIREACQIGSTIITPLYCQGQMLGILAATRALDEPDFTRDSLATLSAIAAQVAVAVRSMQLAEETAYLKEFNEGIVQGVAEAILITDSEEVITFANPAALSMLGYTEAELVGQPALSIVPEAYQERVLLENARRLEGASGHYETALFDVAGREVPVLANARPLFQEGVFAGTLTAFTDVSDLKEAEEQLRCYAADLESHNAELDAFAHTVAHDLKSPLTVLIGFADLLHARGKRFSSREREQLYKISRTGYKMRDIIDELLLLSSVRNVDQLEVVGLDMAVIVQEVLMRMDYMIKSTRAEVSAPAQWPTALGHAPWIEEVWINYLSNALKYGGCEKTDTPPRVEFGYTLPRGDQTQPRFWVRDNGAGLSLEQQQQLFTPFERMHSGRIDGHGLGLSIVRRIIEKLGGVVGVECTLGEGCQFYFTLPLSPENVPDMAEVPTEEVAPARTSPAHLPEELRVALAARPAAWRAELRAAVVDADARRIAAVIAPCYEADSRLARALQSLADNFAHDTLLEWLTLVA